MQFLGHCRLLFMSMTCHLYQWHIVAICRWYYKFFSPILMFDQLQGDIDVMMEWTKLWILSFKSQSTSIYKSEQITDSCYASYILDSAVIGSTDCITDLGILILIWNIVCSKLTISYISLPSHLLTQVLICNLFS